MKIKDIAKMAGVSVSTVSKVVNGKDDSISEETKRKILEIVKKYNYIPYKNIRYAAEKTNIIGLLNKGMFQGKDLLISSLQENLLKKNYYLITDNNFANKNIVEREKNILDKNIDGLIYLEGQASKECFEFLSSPSITFGSDEKYEISIDYEKSFEIILEEFLSKNHKKIACLIPYIAGEEEKNSNIKKAFKRACFEKSIDFEEDYIVYYNKDNKIFLKKVLKLISEGVSGFLCIGYDIAENVYNNLKKMTKPYDISILVIADTNNQAYKTIKYDTAEIPYNLIGEKIARSIIEKIENKKSEQKKEKIILQIKAGESLRFYKEKKNNYAKLLVIGSLNMDIIVRMAKIPVSGDAISADTLTLIPGGKGANQAVGAARLGADVSLIGKIGEDQEGKKLYESLVENGVDTRGVVKDLVYGTGKAYIYVGENGESCIVVYSGSNSKLNMSQIDEFSYIFEENFDYCLLQTEIPMETIKYSIKKAKENGIKIILKPTIIKRIEDDILKDIDIIVPNEKEIGYLVKNNKTIEEKAEELIKKGVKNVIITLGKRGCYYRNKNYGKYFKAANFKAFDTTGAADAFISALAVYLSEGNDMIDAIKYATYAAGISVTREGAQASLPNRMNVDMYLEEINRWDIK